MSELLFWLALLIFAVFIGHVHWRYDVDTAKQALREHDAEKKQRRKR